MRKTSQQLSKNQKQPEKPKPKEKTPLKSDQKKEKSISKDKASDLNHEKSKDKEKQPAKQHNFKLSPSPQKRSRSSHDISRRSSSSPSKVSFLNAINTMTQILTDHRSKLISTLQLYSLLHGTQMQMRCLLHNNNLSLYCLSDKRVLCVNCIYGLNKHRNHKVLPLKDEKVQQLILEENKLLKVQLDDDLKNLQEGLRIAQDNTNILQKEMKKAISSLDVQYKAKCQELKTRYELVRREIVESYYPLTQKTKEYQKVLEEYKFKIWETLSKIGLGKRNITGNTDNQIMQQVFCKNLSQLTKIQVQHITSRQVFGLSKGRHTLDI